MLRNKYTQQNIDEPKEEWNGVSIMIKLDLIIIIVYFLWQLKYCMGIVQKQFHINLTK